MSSTAYFFDYMDFFKAEYNFSNRTSSTAGKFMTVGYLVVFFFLSIQAIINVLAYTEKYFTNTTSYDNYILESGSTTLNKLHMIAYIQLISKSGLPMDHNFAKGLFNDYFSAQVSSLKSKTYTYKKTNLLDFLCNDKSQTLIFCINQEINSINDLIFISINKAQAKTPGNLKSFFDMYSVRIHIDYYFTNYCDNKFFFDLNDWDTYFRRMFPTMVQYQLFDYIVKTQSYYSDALTATNYDIGKSNVELQFQLNNMQLDIDPMVNKPLEIKALSLLSLDVVNSPNLFSFNVKMVKDTENIKFGYLKLPQAFANVMGIMEACKFTFLVFSLMFNFLMQNLSFFDFFFKRNVRFTELDEDPSKLITIIPLKSYQSTETEKVEEKKATEHVILGLRNNPKPNLKNESFGPQSDRNFKRVSERPGKKKKVTISNDQMLTNYFSLEDKEVSSLKEHTIKDKLMNYNSELSEPKAYSIFSACKLLCCCGTKQKKMERRLMLFSLMEVFQKTDVFYVYKRLKDIELLKYLLLSEKQRNVLDFVQKEQIIYDEKSEKVLFYAPYKDNSTDEKKIETTMNFIEEGQKSQLITDVDKRLYNIIDDTLL